MFQRRHAAARGLLLLLLLVPALSPRAYAQGGEEADALRSVLVMASDKKVAKTLSPSLARLKKLDEEGLLEAYILLGRPDQGNAQDHAAYLRQNRDKLRRDIVQYALTGGGGK